MSNKSILENKYILFDSHLCKKKNKNFKYYISLKQFSLSTQEEIVKYINENYSDLIIQKYPCQKKLLFVINGKNYLEQYWSKLLNDFIVNLYPIVIKEESIKFDIVNNDNLKKYWVNIFRGSELVEYDPNNYYLIKYDKDNHRCYLIDQNNNPITNEREIIMQQNFFTGKNIGVDISIFEKFNNNEIRNFISDCFQI